MDVVVPYFKAKIETMRAINPGRCKPFGDGIRESRRTNCRVHETPHAKPDDQLVDPALLR